ncbi:MAG: hypothetical protein PHC75_01245 [Burkholderiales bacterium]|nr:hypothetical protein [Burkholderiales bacterium]
MVSLRISPAAFFLVVFTLSLGGYYLSIAGILSNEATLILLTSILLVYLFAESVRLYLYDSRRFLINPVFQCSLMTLGLYYGINNILYFLPVATVGAVGIDPIITTSMVKLELLTIIAAGGMWIGYWSEFSLNVVDSSICNNLRQRYFVHDAKLKLNVFIIIMLVSVLSRLLQLEMGIYGYAAGYKAIMKAAVYTQYFNLLASLGKLSVIIIALEYYRDSYPNKMVKFLFYFTIIMEVYLGGFVTGFKSAVMMPFILVLLCQYARTGKMSLVWLVCIVVSISAAYPLVERFRAIRDSANDAFPSTSLVQISRIMFFPTQNEINSASYSPDDHSAPTYLKIMSRTSMLQIGGYGIDYYDKRDGDMPDSSPDVISDIILSPLYAWIPRFIWAGKTVQNLGIWYTQVIMKMPYSFSSTAMGTLTYLYIGGTYWLTFVGFLFLGVLQRVVREIFQPWLTCSGSLLTLVLVGMISSIAEINLDAIIVLLVRVVPMVIIIQKLIYNHKEIR